jgi:hypothetical protein
MAEADTPSRHHRRIGGRLESPDSTPDDPAYATMTPSQRIAAARELSVRLYAMRAVHEHQPQLRHPRLPGRLVGGRR